jgi:hypothetical protein
MDGVSSAGASIQDPALACPDVGIYESERRCLTCLGHVIAVSAAIPMVGRDGGRMRRIRDSASKPR